MAKKYIDVSLAPIYFNSEACEQIKYMPTSDVQEVIRCKNCIYYKEGNLLSPNKFCFRLKHNGKMLVTIFHLMIFVAVA